MQYLASVGFSDSHPEQRMLSVSDGIGVGPRISLEQISGKRSGNSI
jgi:hypothetical protein